MKWRLASKAMLFSTTGMVKRILNKHGDIVFLCLVIVCVVLILFLLPRILSSHYFSTADEKAVSTTTAKKIIFIPSYVSTPEPVKGIYMTSWVAGTPSLRAGLVKLIDETELNTLVIDIKDYSGKIVFPIEDNPKLKDHGSEEVRVKDLQDFIETLHKKQVYVIGRIAVFQDEYFVKHRPDLAVKNKSGTAVWKDRKGISWIDPASREYWEYIILLTKESRKIGFDEINFDYIRFPSDGNMQDISFPHSSTTSKAIVLKEFFQYLQHQLILPMSDIGDIGDIGESRLKISADLFGMTTTAVDDMGIGQLLENTLPYFDYVMPMVYPSHYPPTFDGFKDPEAHPYEIVYFAMKSAVTRAEALASTTPVVDGDTVTTGQAGQSVVDYKNKLRPWLQDFGLKMDYGPAEVKAQIKATNDVGLSSWVLWSASNKYTQSALKAD